MAFLLYELFPSIIDMSITASFVIVFVLVTRFLLKKTPKIFTYALWGVVLFRLLCPITFESAIGLLPVEEQIVTFTPETQPALVEVQLPPIEVATSPIEYTENSDVGVSVSTAIPTELVFMIIWIIGIIAMSIYSIRQYIKLKRKIIISIPLKDNIFLADNINSPFVIGLFCPKIYLPSSLPQNEYSFIIAHEMCHIKRLDHITRILAFIALTIHWFNPLVWMAFIISAKDMEMACDESVMKNMETDIRAEYATSLLRIATSKRLITATPLAFGEGNPKTRVTNIMKYKKPLIWVSVSAIIVVAVLTVGFMSTPADNSLDIYIDDFSQGETYTFDDRSITLDTSLEDNLELLAFSDYYYRTSGEFDKLQLGTNDNFNMLYSNEQRNFEQGEYIENYIIHDIYAIDDMHSLVENQVVFESEIDEIYRTAEEFNLSDYKLIAVDVSIMHNEASLASGPQLGDGRYTYYHLFGKVNLDDEYKLYYSIPPFYSPITPEYATDLQGFVGQVLSPNLDVRDTLGTDVVLDYADDEKIIFHGYFGLFIYNLHEERITLAIDLQRAVGANNIQGIPFTDVKMNADKDTLMIYHNAVYGAHKDLDALYIDIESEQYGGF